MGYLLVLTGCSPALHIIFPLAFDGMKAIRQSLWNLFEEYRRYSFRSLIDPQVIFLIFQGLIWLIVGLGDLGLPSLISILSFQLFLHVSHQPWVSSGSTFGFFSVVSARSLLVSGA
jgi:hypothetical protein